MLGFDENHPTVGRILVRVSIDANAIATALREAGVDIAAEALAPETRDGRIVVELPGDRLAWFPSAPGQAWSKRKEVAP
jgi:hypothetical protein